MRLTTARYYTPSGRSIQEIGVTPDIKVEQMRIEAIGPRRRTREADLRGALKNDNGKNHVGDKKDKFGEKSDNKSKKAPNSKKKPAPAVSNSNRQDFQLQRALDLLRGVSLFSRLMKG